MSELIYRLRMNPSDKVKHSMQRDGEAAADEIERLRKAIESHNSRALAAGLRNWAIDLDGPADGCDRCGHPEHAEPQCPNNR